jgi:hypothetical protein
MINSMLLLVRLEKPGYVSRAQVYANRCIGYNILYSSFLKGIMEEIDDELRF